MRLLIVKLGALGDVVRTSYFARALKQKFGGRLRLSWVTAPASADLLRFNANVDDLWTNFESTRGHRFDRVYSLDDEIDTLQAVSRINAVSITGAFLKDGVGAYTEDSAAWFDMGLLSRYGKARADELKKRNQRSHAEIFSEIFQVKNVAPDFYGDPENQRWAASLLPQASCVGINPYSGGRWPSKELTTPVIHELIDKLLGPSSPFGDSCHVVLLGAREDFQRNLELVARVKTPRLRAVNTDESVQHFAAVISRLRYLITSDSLALHLAVAQGIPFTAFFSPTSAAEIDTWSIGSKLTSTAPDYCSYRKDADNSSITASRILVAIQENKAAKVR